MCFGKSYKVRTEFDKRINVKYNIVKYNISNAKAGGLRSVILCDRKQRYDYHLCVPIPDFIVGRL